MEDARAHYGKRLDEAKADAASLGARAAAISLSRVIVFVTLVGSALAGRFTKLGSAGYALAVVAAALFVVLMAVHERVFQRRRRAEASIEWAKEGLARLDGTFARDAKPGEPKAEDAHPYAGDLDILARGGILQSIDATRTAQARARLGAWLLAPSEPAEVRARQRAARDLAPRVDFRERLAVEGSLVAEEPPDPTPLLAWTANGSGLSSSPLLRAIAIALPALAVALLLFGGALPLPRATWVAILAVQALFASRFRGQVKPAIEAASEHHASLERFARMLQVIENEKFADEGLIALQARIATGPASADIARLSRIVGFVEARRNEVFKLLVAPLLLWDLNCAFALEAWRRRAGTGMAGHLDALFRIEVLSTFAARAFERPDDAWPEIEDAIALDAAGLGHPLIAGPKLVRNDVRFDGAGSVLLVTGSNMSGKSTLMRAIGSNVVLALAGAPVRATSMRTARFAVWTSMRVRDDLQEGVSHFFAELRRLKSVVDAADAATESFPVLFLLDEILHGTNSRERHLGAQAIVRRLVTRRACGAVSTHDLALADLERELAGHVKNVHFREQVETVEGKETMTFDYALRPGVVTSSNALRLMRIVGLDVDVPS